MKRLRLNDDETLEMQAAHQLSATYMINILYVCRVCSLNYAELGLILAHRPIEISERIKILKVREQFWDLDRHQIATDFFFNLFCYII